MSEILFPTPVVWLSAEAAPLHAMVYAPGLLCEQCHEQLGNGFVFRSLAGLLLTGSTCLVGGFKESPSPWLTALDRAQQYGPLWPVDESRIQRHRRTLARGLGLLLQVEPDHRFAMRLFQVLERGADLSKGQSATVAQMFHERGGLATMKRRRDLIHRLKNLKALPLNNADFDWVLDVLDWAHSWRSGFQDTLTQNHKRKIIYLEEHYRLDRLTQMRESLPRWQLMNQLMEEVRVSDEN